MKKPIVFICLLIIVLCNVCYANVIKWENKANYNETEYIELKTTDAAGFLKYTNPKYGYSIFVPETFNDVRGYELSGEYTFEKDLTTKLTINARNNFLNYTLDEQYQNDVQFIKKQDIKYTDHGDTWYVINWVDILSANYKKVFIQNGYITEFTFRCAPEDCRKYSNVISVIEANFTPSTVSETKPSVNEEQVPTQNPAVKQGTDDTNPKESTNNLLPKSSQTVAQTTPVTNKKTLEKERSIIDEVVQFLITIVFGFIFLVLIGAFFAAIFGLKKDTTTPNRTLDTNNKLKNTAKKEIVTTVKSNANQNQPEHIKRNVFKNFTNIDLYGLISHGKNFSLIQASKLNYLFDSYNNNLIGMYVVNTSHIRLQSRQNSFLPNPLSHIFQITDLIYETYPEKYPAMVRNHAYARKVGYTENASNFNICCPCKKKNSNAQWYIAIAEDKLIIVPHNGLKCVNDKSYYWNYRSYYALCNTDITNINQVEYYTSYLLKGITTSYTGWCDDLKDAKIFKTKFQAEQFILSQQNKFIQSNKRASQKYKRKDVDNIKDWRVFEQFIYRRFKEHGYKTTLTSATNDGGKDIIVEKNGVKTYIECKYWQTGHSIGRELIQKLAGAAMMDGVKNAIFITTSSYHSNAYDAARKLKSNGFNIQLWDTDKLLKFINN
ncbi:restriction endonuclease [Megamonas hypermegale]|uniref:restriction endonuclease n=1 Tax=Megamonas hypermegale TaxID=158847 RepID=UPI0026F0655A|nr:restriction endonuclease [Megamonas hypermegale]